MNRQFTFHSLFCVLLFTIFSSAFPMGDAPIYFILNNDTQQLTEWLDSNPGKTNKVFEFVISERPLRGLFYGTLLHCATIMNNPEIINLLVNHGASVEVTGIFINEPKKMYTLLDFAQIYRKTEAQTELKQLGATCYQKFLKG